MDPDRRRVLRLGALGVVTLAGGGWLLYDRTRDSADVRGAAGSTSSGSSTTNPSTATTDTSYPGGSPDTTTTGRETTTSEPSAANAGAVAGEALMLCRESWGAAAPSRAVPPHEVVGLMVHHTAVRLDDNRVSPDRIRGHQRYHQSRGFADIAYHVFVDARGNVYEGRDPAVPGETFTDYDTTGWFLVVCEGNFDEQPLPDAQRDALVRVLAWASKRYGIAPESIAAHRQHAHTRCPGDAIHSLVLDGTIARLTRQATPSTLAEICGPEADERIAEVRAGTR